MDDPPVIREGAGVDKDIVHIAYGLTVVDESWRISFIIVWNVAGELHSLKNMTVGSNSPQLVWNAAFHSSPSLIHTLLNPHWRSSTVKNSPLQRGVRTLEMRGSRSS